VKSDNILSYDPQRGGGGLLLKQVSTGGNAFCSTGSYACTPAINEHYHCTQRHRKITQWWG